MTTQDIIEKYRDVVIQLATPYSTGTGFYLKEYDLIITNEHVVRNNKSVVINGEKFEKQLADIVYVDPLYDLAFLMAPKDHSMPQVSLSLMKDYSEGDGVIAAGHPFGLKIVEVHWSILMEWSSELTLSSLEMGIISVFPYRYPF